jgi:hypothetical protein
MGYGEARGEKMKTATNEALLAMIEAQAEEIKLLKNSQEAMKRTLERLQSKEANSARNVSPYDCGRRSRLS